MLVFGLCCFQLGALAAEDAREGCGLRPRRLVYVRIGGAYVGFGLGEGYGAEFVGWFGCGGLGLRAATLAGF